MDDLLSYEIPDELTIEHLAGMLISDFTVYESAVRSAATPMDNAISRAITKKLLQPSPHLQKNQMLKSYASGSAEVKDAVKVLRWAYVQRAVTLEKTASERELSPLEMKFASSLRALLSQSDYFFAAALRMAKPALAALATAYEQGEK